MATEADAKALVELINNAIEFQSRELIERREWGSISFEAASPDLKRIFTILDHLKILPIEYLTDAAVAQIRGEIDKVIALFQKVDEFNIEQANPTQVRDQLISQLHAQADQFYTIATPWIPFLAYQKGDVAQNIEALTTSVKNAETLVENAKGNIKDKEGEIEKIITAAREASAGAGAAVFTKDFNNEAGALNEKAIVWLRVTAILALGTIAMALIMYFLVEPGADKGEILQKFGSKLAILGILIAATVWCGRNYKALMHQATINKHRALSLQTFQAFSRAASDAPTKDAVLMEATRAIFSNTSTGYVEQKSDGSESSLRVVELARVAPLAKALDEGSK